MTKIILPESFNQHFYFWPNFMRKIRNNFWQSCWKVEKSAIYNYEKIIIKRIEQKKDYEIQQDNNYDF